MKKYLKYLLIVAFSVGSFNSIFARVARMDSIPPVIIQDSTVRFPVKSTHISTYEDLENTTPIDLKNPSNVITLIEYDPITRRYVIKTKIGDKVVATPFSLSPDEYYRYTLKESMSEYFRKRNKMLEEGEETNDFSLKDIRVNIGAAERLFGPGGVRIQANGYVEAVMGMKQTSINNPSLPQKSRKRTSFDFDENIQVNATASVGERINFDMNYDTESMFDFDSKKINLSYDGEEDEIVKHISAGNVSMATTNSLINGGTALFGINTELQFGKLRVNAVLSQQEAESKSVTAPGGVQTNRYEIRVDDYDENRHFFLAHYFRDNYDRAMSKLPLVNSPIEITKIEVWVTNKRNDFSQARDMVAFADLAERDSTRNPLWLKGSRREPTNGSNNLYEKITTEYKVIRQISSVTSTLTMLENGLDYEKIEKARLLNSSEYSLNSKLGYISLTSALQADEVLAVAYQYRMNGEIYRVGEFASNISDAQQDNTNTDPSAIQSGALFLKLLKPVSMSPLAYTWNLMMKNVYSIGANNIQKDKFQLQISYQSDSLGTYTNYLPEGKIKGEMLLRVMGLDRLDTRGNARPRGDGIFDFEEGYTIRAENGRIYFPVVEPFGSHLEKQFHDTIISNKYVYKELYTMTKTEAQQIAEKNKYRIQGSYRGSSTDNDIMLNATNVPQGSVRVTAAGRTLTEGVDYIVDYMSGRVSVINQNLIESNTPIQVSSEDRTFSMQRKTMMGLNLNYDISKKINVGATIMHLYEKPLTTKVEMGNESMKNTLWGVNASYKTESQWLTNLVDKLPFVEASQPSQIALNAEFAHLIAGHYQSGATGAYSYLDDFESSQSKIDIKSPYAWTLASTPRQIADSSNLVKKDAIEYGLRRAHLAWFMIDGLFSRKNSNLTPNHIKNDKEQLADHFVREIKIEEIYPNKDITPTDEGTMPVLNLSYYPKQRGAYNLDIDGIESDGSLSNPKSRWGGITRKIDVRDFESSNIEYVEFWLLDPFVYKNGEHGYPKNEGGKLYINLGEISEDIIKDGKKFFENGLPIDGDPSAYEGPGDGIARVPTRQSTGYAFNTDVSADARARQDVGLDGLSTKEEQEAPIYIKYLAEYKSQIDLTALTELTKDLFSPINDPAGDNYHFYRGTDYDEAQVSILNRYKYYNGTEGNSPDAEGSGNKYSTAARSVPDVEDIDQDNTLNETEAYWEYEIDLRPDAMKVGSNYIVDSREYSVSLKEANPETVTWYQFKIPVKKGRNIGKIHNFKSIRYMRMYLTEFAQETYLRFATLQLVRGDWRVYEQKLAENLTSSGTGTIDVSMVNIEENGQRKPVNYVLPPGLNRALDPDQTQLTKENEQSMSFKVSDLSTGNALAVYKNTMYDLRRYKRLQLYTHAEELISGEPLSRGEMTVFLRLGSDYKNNYYEYEIPLTITPHGIYSMNNPSDQEIVWPTNNKFDFKLEVLKNLKLQRNRAIHSGLDVAYNKAFSDYDPDNSMNRITVKGNPSLSEVNVIMIGVRNDSRKDISGEVWANELRLTDFDEEGGWAAQGNVSLALSDIATVDVSGRKETVGFGGLDQSLMERRMDDLTSYSIATSANLGRFLPEKAKLNIPFTYGYSSEVNSPKYDPYDQDVTMKEALDVVDTKQKRDSIKSLAQTRTTNKSIAFNNIKLDIKSKNPMPYDPANFTFGYLHNETDFRDPTTAYDVSMDEKLNFGYLYAPLINTWEPFKNMKSKSGAAKYLKSLGFNYLPSTIGVNSVASRQYNETLMRDLDSYSIGGSNNNTFLTWNQILYKDRDFNLSWDFTRNLKFTFQSGTRAEVEDPYRQIDRQIDSTEYQIWKTSVWRNIGDFGTPLEHKQNASLTYQLPWRSIPAMDWLSTSASYRSEYEWERGATIIDTEIGNVISNSGTFDLNNRLDLTRLYNKSGFLKRVNQRFDARTNRGTPVRQQRASAQKRRFTQRVQLQEEYKDKMLLRHGLGTKNIEVIAKQEDGIIYKLKFKKVDENSIQVNSKDTISLEISILSKLNTPKEGFFVDFGEYSARALMSVRSVGINYSRRQETYLPGYRPMVGKAFGQKNSEYGSAPGLGFAFGFDGQEDFINKSLSRDWLVMNDSININPAVLNKDEKLDIRVQIEPFRGFKVELTAARETNERTELYYMHSTSQGIPRNLGGSFSMTTVALSSALRSSKADNNYESAIFNKFLSNRTTIQDRLEAKYQGKLPTGAEPAPRATSGDVMIPAFIAAYTGKSVESVSLSAFPSLSSLLPNWRISYDVVNSIPSLKSTFKAFTFSHAYTSFYQVSNYDSYTDWSSIGDGLGYSKDVVDASRTLPSSQYDISSVAITEAFNPLIGAEGILNNNMSINSRYNNRRTVNLNMSSYQIIESIQNEFIVGFGYRINEFNRLIGLKSRKENQFNNDLNIKIDLSHKMGQALIRKIEEQFTQATSGNTTTTIMFSADYAFSKAVTLRAFFDRIVNQPLISSNGYPTTNTNFGLSMKFMLQ